jgi:hypothetical protein
VRDLQAFVIEDTEALSRLDSLKGANPGLMNIKSVRKEIATVSCALSIAFS